MSVSADYCNAKIWSWGDPLILIWIWWCSCTCDNTFSNHLCSFSASPFRHLVCIQQRCPAARLQPNPGPSQLTRAQASWEHSKEVADQPCSATQLWQSWRSRQEARPQAQEEPRRHKEEHGHYSRLTEGLGRQRCHATGWDSGRGKNSWTPTYLPTFFFFFLFIWHPMITVFSFSSSSVCVMKGWAVAPFPSLPHQACRAVVRRKERRGLTPSLCHPPWPSSSTVCCSPTRRMTRWVIVATQGARQWCAGNTIPSLPRIISLY